MNIYLDKGTLFKRVEKIISKRLGFQFYKVPDSMHSKQFIDLHKYFSSSIFRELIKNLL